VYVSGEPPVGNAIWTWPNAVSLLRLLLVPVFAVLIWHEHDWWAIGVLMFSGFTDWLDGWLARRLNQTSKLGQMLDPAADRLYILVTLIGLAWREMVPWWLVAVILIRELFLSVVLLALLRKGYGPLEVNYVGKAGTLCLLYAFPMLLGSSLDGWVGTAAYVGGWAFSWWGIGLYWLAGVTYTIQAWSLLRVDGDTAATPA